MTTTATAAPPQTSSAAATGTASEPAAGRETSPSDVPPAKRQRLAPAPTSTPSAQTEPAPPTLVLSSTPKAATVPSVPAAAAVEPADERALVEEQMALPIEYVKTYATELDYRDKLVLAPMVRTGTLPTRLLSLYYGAGLVWSPEIVDKAIIGAERTVDPKTGVITYSKGQGAIFTTHPIEKPYLVFQIGTSDPELAVKAAKVVQQDVSGIDLNCGCPKPFSTHSGMGAALLSTPDLLLSILRALLDSIPLPISCKIRLLPTQPSTLYLVSRILRTGIRNLTVHCRTRDMRSSERALWERLADIVQLGKRRGLPVICNGDGDGWANWEKIRSQTGATSVMLARSAERNPSVFQPTGPAPITTQIYPQLLNIAEYTNNNWGNTKFLLNQFKPNGSVSASASTTSLSSLAAGPSRAEKKATHEALNKAKSVVDVATHFRIELGKGAEFFAELEERLAAREAATKAGKEGDGPLVSNEQPKSVWAERAEAEKNGIVDSTQDPVVESEEEQEQARVDGFQVGVGQAGAVLAVESAKVEANEDSTVAVPPVSA